MLLCTNGSQKVFYLTLLAKTMAVATDFCPKRQSIRSFRVPNITAIHVQDGEGAVRPRLRNKFPKAQLSMQLQINVLNMEIERRLKSDHEYSELLGKLMGM